MNNHTLKIKEHQFIKNLKYSLELTDSILDEVPEEHTHLAILRRIQVVLTNLIIIYNNTDPLMIDPNKISNFEVHSANLKSYLNSFRSQQHPNYINNASITLNTLIDFFSYFIYPKTGREMAGLRLATEKYQSVIESYINELQEKISLFEQTSSEVSATVQDDLSKNLERLESFETLIKSKQDALSEEYNQLQNQLTNDYKTLHDKAMLNYEEKYEEIHNNADNLFDNISKDYDAKVEEYQSTLDHHITEVQRIVGALAERSISYGFKQIADEEKEYKEKWNNFALAGFILMISFTIFMILFSFFIEFHWGTLLLRGLGGIGAFGAFVAFCSKQANVHAEVERESRKRELELASLGPFFAGYEKDELFEIRKKLADRYFGTNSNSSLNNIHSDKK